MKEISIIFLSFFLSFLTFGQTNAIYFHPNRGQWDANILYSVDLQNGHFYLDKDGYTIFLRSFNHHADYSGKEKNMAKEQLYAFKIKYVNSLQSTDFEENVRSTFYRNYFLGNNPADWKSHVFSYESVLRKNMYQGIDVETKNEDGAMAVDYFVQPHADPTQIQLQYDGFQSVEIEKDGSLKMTHPLGFVTESIPKAWNINASGVKSPIEVEYKLKDNVVSFVFPNGYDSNKQLVIDPVLEFSTFTGSTSDNWGFTATPDPQGNAFGGGISFGNGYPVTAGVYDNSFNGGTVDVAITKFNSNGTALIYSTYVGGSDSETPNSMICNPAGELYVMGITGSSNFPTSATAFQKTNNLGTHQTLDGINFTNGTDIYVFKLSPDGATLSASTFLGGTGNDGLNLNSLVYNYGDHFRGDIELDAMGNVFVASTTYSTDFPTANTSISSSNGSQDAVAFKLNANLSSLLWSTYLGGSSYDAAYSIQVATDGSVYVAGGSNSQDFIFPSGLKPSSNGNTDGFIAKFNSAYQLVKGTFIGTTNYDQVYFVQLDLDQNVYVLGQSLGQMAITPGKWGVSNSGQFIKKFDESLSTELWTTLIGTGFKRIDISPTAFMVSDCYDIYLAGWGGLVNQQNSQAIHSSTTGLPVTSDAFQSTTNGSNFYIAVLDPDAAGLKYATFIGGTASSANHVDGGTSRFDKSGKIYHAVCGACGGNDHGFTTTPGVYSETNNSPNCNMAVFKFEISFIETHITNAQPVVCFPDVITFNNVTTTGTEYTWDFGDGTTSNDLHPTHEYAQPGTFTVSFVVKDSENCFVSDTAKFVVNVKDFQANAAAIHDTVCPGTPVTLHASGGESYTWSPANFLDNATSADPVATLPSTTTFTVIVSDADCGTDTAFTTVKIFNDSIQLSSDTTICQGTSIQLSASGAVSYSWSPSTNLSDPTIGNPIATPTNDITYTVTGVSVHNCTMSAQTNIHLVNPPFPDLPDSAKICLGDSKTITVNGGATSYLWNPNTEIDTLAGNSVTITPTSSRYYYCDFSNACGTVRDSIFAKVVKVVVKAWNDTIICPGESAPLFASGAKHYVWSPTVTSQSSSGDIVLAHPTAPTTYTVTGTDENGCSASATVFVNLYPKPVVIANPTIYAILDEQAHLGVQTNSPGTYIWSPGEYLSCTQCMDPYANPNKNFVYTVTYIDENGCKDTATQRIEYDAIVYVPNSFTPDGSEFNDVFRVVGVNVKNVKVDIYDRWGELIYTIHGLDDFWDGTYLGLKCPIGTYVWKMEYTDVITDLVHVKAGHINLLK